MTDGADTIPFDTLVGDLRNRDDLSTSRTMDTVRYRAATSSSADASAILPRVEHLVALGELLGAGGVGEVLTARQTSLERRIAVKRPRTRGDHESSSLLLREARVIGFVEHPNVPPVHFVGSNDADELLVGLKQIHGETLTERLSRERPGEHLGENLDLLVQVCNAVGYAHSLGIVHLDIKPDNIMTGHYGEVYVLDWGLAAAWRDDVPDVIPRQPDDDRLRGTPAFLAPEMITNEGADPSTDVYLLGGVLHYILTHEPPNAGSTGLDALRAAYDPPQRAFADFVPETLADICRRALARNPADRYRDADELREAIVAFRSHQREVQAADAARRNVAELASAVAADAESADVYKRYGAARQALEELTRADPEAALPSSLLQQSLEEMIDWELRRENVGSAELMIAELPAANENLIAECAVVRRRLADERTELRDLRQQFDLSVGRWSKAAVTLSIAVILGLTEWVPFFIDVPATPQRVLTGYVIYIALLTVLVVVARRMLFATRSNRGLISSIGLLSSYGLSLRAGAYVDAIPLHAAFGYDLALVCVTSMFAAVNFDRRVFAVAPFYGIAAVACFAAPDVAALVFGTGHFVALTTLAISLAIQRDE